MNKNLFLAFAFLVLVLFVVLAFYFSNQSIKDEIELNRLAASKNADSLISLGSNNTVTIPSDTLVTSRDFYIDVGSNEIEGYGVVHKFGTNEGLSTSWEVVSDAGVYQTPTSAQTLEILSDDVNDAYGDVGAWSVLILGLNSSWDEVETEVNLSGTTPVTIPTDYIRVYRAYVSKSGSYATLTTQSHEGTITIRNSVGGETWAQISLIGGLATGQTQMAAYTVPAGKKAFIMSKTFVAEGNKLIDVSFFQRRNADVTSAPYGTMRLINHYHGLSGESNFGTIIPQNHFLEKTDIGFLAKVDSGTGVVSANFEIMLVDE